MSVRLIEVGPRDGLQNENVQLHHLTRTNLIIRLAHCGLRHIEVGSFVSPQAIPQMQHTDRVLKKLHQSSTRLPTGRLHWPCLVPNLKGLQNALACGAREVAIFASCTESFSQHNINCSIKQSFQRFKQLMPLAQHHHIKVRAYLSVAFGCPYEGQVPMRRVIKSIDQLLALGAYEVSVGDTIGTARPGEVKKLLRSAKSLAPRLALHFHNTYGMGLANVLQALECGAQVFDASIGGLGGCPYAKPTSKRRVASGSCGSSNLPAGNVATENVVAMLQSLGLLKSISLPKLLQTRTWLEKKLKNRRSL